jgi:hypothetical protein
MSSSGFSWTPVLLVLLAGAGFFVPFWPFATLAVMLAGALRWPALGLCIGVVLDLLWGAPGGLFGALEFPLTLGALLAFVLRLLADKYFFHHAPLKTLY